MKIYQISKYLHPSGSRQMRRSRLQHSIFPAIYIALLATLLTACAEEEFSSTLIDLEPGCVAQTLSWVDGGDNMCSVETTARDQGETEDLTDIRIPSVGIATFRCDNEIWINETSRCEAAPVGERSLDISLTAADGSRLYEYFSDAFGEVGRRFINPLVEEADAYWLTSSLPEYVQVGKGVKQFPFDGAWDEVITINYNVSGLTGIGTESAPISTGTAAGDFDRYIPGDRFILEGFYTTDIEVNSGSIELVDGQPVQITSLDATVTFTLDPTTPHTVGPLPFDGSLVITNDAFDLFVGGDEVLRSNPTNDPRCIEDPRPDEAVCPGDGVWVWDATGVINPVSYQ